MQVSRKLGISLLLAMLVLAAALPVAAAAPAAGTTHDVTTGTATFTIPAGQCPNLPAGISVSGTGDRTTTTDTINRADGSSWMSINDIVQGAAVDNNGVTYTFFYGNFSTYDAPASGAAKARMYDLFLLANKASAANKSYVLRNGFVWRWTFTPPAGPFDVLPLPNLQKLITFGDPINSDTIAPHCDPL